MREGFDVRQASRAELHLPVQEVAPTQARDGIRRIVDELPATIGADLLLLTSELVANAVRHAPHGIHDEIVLRIAVDETITVEVADAGELFTPPSHHPPFDARTSGWGLFLVDAMARSWGVDPDGTGKKVWFELDRGAEVVA